MSTVTETEAVSGVFDDPAADRSGAFTVRAAERVVEILTTATLATKHIPEAEAVADRNREDLLEIAESPFQEVTSPAVPASRHLGEARAVGPAKSKPRTVTLMEPVAATLEGEEALTTGLWIVSKRVRVPARPPPESPPLVTATDLEGPIIEAVLHLKEEKEDQVNPSAEVATPNRTATEASVAKPDPTIVIVEDPEDGRFVTTALLGVGTSVENQ